MTNDVDWDELVEELGPKLYRYFYARFNGYVADELTQETLVRLVKKWQSGKFDPQKGSLTMWAFGIARFVRLEYFKNPNQLESFDSALDNIQADSCLATDLEHHQEIIMLRQEIAQLPEPQQEIILLIIDKEFSLGKIAELLNLSIGTVKSHVHRAKATLSIQMLSFFGGPNGQ